MSNFKVEFTLKQHTPIIHFQSDQMGATLRATELKPKFDRFLKETVFKNTFDEYKTFLIGYDENKKQNEIDFDKEAFDYKIKILSPLEKYENEIKSPLFFGNMGNSVQKKSKLNNQTFNIEFSSLKNSKLIELIKNDFPIFLAQTNFGMRQSKGFGSFYLDKNCRNYISIDKILHNIDYLEIDSTESTKVDEIIKYFWTRFKSGINLNYNNKCDKPYEKSFSFEYLNDKNLVDENNNKFNWDKRWIKETFFGIEKNNQKSVFLRAYLGLGSTYTYKKTTESCNPCKNKKTIEDDYQIEVFSDSIKRIQAPIMFKPITEDNKTKIYMIINDIKLPKNSKFYFIKRFNFVYDNYQVNNKPKYKKSLYPEIDISNEKLQNKQKENFNKFKATKKNTLNGFDYLKQFDRFEEFLKEFCTFDEKGLHIPKKFELSPPENFNFLDMYEKYLVFLGATFEAKYINRQVIEKITVKIKNSGNNHE